MKKQALFFVMLASLSGVAASAGTGGLSWLVPSALASDDAGSADRQDAKDRGGARQSGHDGEDGAGAACACPPGVTSCTCSDGSPGTPATDSVAVVPGALRSIYGK